MGKAIGIDLGTTNSVVGVRIINSTIIPNSEGETLTPSVVGYLLKKEPSGPTRPHELVVGSKAKDLLLQDPENTISSVKRLMGRSFEDKEVQNLVKNSGLTYKVAPLSQGTSSSIAVCLTDGSELTPSVVSSEILKKLKRDAEDYLQDEITEAVITVPAYFNEKQKHATYQAAEIAGFQVSRLLSEPTAAAIAYGIDEHRESKTLLVYDFGGGTLDISVLSYADGHFMEQAKGGDMWLGGDDIDLLLVQFVVRNLEEEFGIVRFEEFLATLSRGDQLRLKGQIKRAAEIAKIELSSKMDTIVEINSSVRAPNGRRIEFDLELTRDHLDEIIQPLVLKSEQLVGQVLDSIHFSAEIVDLVLMVGGSSSIPAFQNSLKKIFGESKVKIHERPLHAIAEGAAILAKKMAGSPEDKPELGHIMYRSAHDYYLKLANGEHLLLVAKQSPLPTTVQKVLKYEHPSQLIGHFCFSSSDDGLQKSIGELWLTHFPKHIGYDPDQKAAEVELDFTVTEDELVKVEVRLKNEPEVFLSKTISRGEENEKLFQELFQTINSFNESMKDDSKARSKGFNFLYFSAAIAHQIASSFQEQANRQSEGEITEKLASINQKISMAKKACGLIEKDDDPLFLWNRFLFLDNIAGVMGNYFEDREKYRQFKELVAKAKGEMQALKSIEAMEEALNTCDELLQTAAPEAGDAMAWSAGMQRSEIDPSYHSQVRLGLLN